MCHSSGDSGNENEPLSESIVRSWHGDSWRKMLTVGSTVEVTRLFFEIIMKIHLEIKQKNCRWRLITHNIDGKVLSNGEELHRLQLRISLAGDSNRFLVGILAPVIDVYWLSAEIFADLGLLLSRFRTFSKLTYWNPITTCEERDRK
jgi:hypothetical protein